MNSRGIPSLPSPLDLMESMRYVVEGTKIFEFKGLTGKILKTKALTLTRSFSSVKPLIAMVRSVVR